jgi:DNA mismatch endonuclease (patch repair protein)
MARIGGKNTAPEMAVRRLLHSIGYRFRLHISGLPGKPDIVFPGRQKVVLVHGCFWHRHPGCRYAYMPKSRVEFWRAKFERNVQRDAENLRALGVAGWKVFTVWECEVQMPDVLRHNLTTFLGAPSVAEAKKENDVQ